MRPSAAQSQILTELLDQLSQHGLNQTQIVNTHMPKTTASDLSNAKNGLTISDAKWDDIVAGIERGLKAKRFLDKDNLNADELKRYISILKGKEDDLKISREQLAADEELERAYRALRLNREINPHLWTFVNKQRPIRAARTAFLGIRDGLSKFQAELSNALSAEFKPVKSPGVTYDAKSDWLNYDRIINWEQAQTSALICLFPFYLTAPRRLAWGVLPYARCTAIGILCPQYLISKDSVTITPGDCAPLLEDTTGINYILGYSMHEIFCEMIIDLNKVSYLEDFNGKIQPPLSNIDGAKDKLFGSELLLFDLSLWNDVEKTLMPSLNGAYRMVRLAHKINVPVGIGFSLQALPWLVQDSDRPDRLRNIAMEKLEPYADGLQAVGVELLSKSVRSK